jgi:hypothetical protein
MVKNYWREVHRRAAQEARHALWIETKDRAMIAIILAAVSLVVIWTIGGKEAAWGELIVRMGATIAVVLAFPLVYAWKMIVVPAKLAAEKQAALGSGPIKGLFNPGIF